MLLEAWPAERCDEDAAKALRGAFAVGSRRTALQDLRFLIDELVEIAARALSPGVNDPFTANSCLDWLGAAMADLARRDLPSRLRADEDETLRVIAHPMTFAGFIDRAFGALAQYASADMIAGKRFLDALGDVALGCDDPGRIATLARADPRLPCIGRERAGRRVPRRGTDPRRRPASRARRAGLQAPSSRRQCLAGRNRMIVAVALIVAIIVTIALTFGKFARSDGWRATVTPACLDHRIGFPDLRTVAGARVRQRGAWARWRCCWRSPMPPAG